MPAMVRHPRHLQSRRFCRVDSGDLIRQPGLPAPPLSYIRLFAQIVAQILQEMHRRHL